MVGGGRFRPTPQMGGGHHAGAVVPVPGQGCSGGGHGGGRLPEGFSAQGVPAFLHAGLQMMFNPGIGRFQASCLEGAAYFRFHACGVAGAAQEIIAGEFDEKLSVDRSFLRQNPFPCLLYTSDAADDLLCVDLCGSRIIQKKKKNIDAGHVNTHHISTTKCRRV